MFLLLLACNGDANDSAPAVDDTGQDDTGPLEPDPIAEAFDLDRSLFRHNLSQYVSTLLVNQVPHSREALRRRLHRTVL